MTITAVSEPDARPRILVVDDDRGLRRSLQRAFQQAGFDVEGVSDAHAAAERFGQAQPHVVVLDVMLPRGDGVELCRQIRRRPGGQEVAIIFVTARDAVADRVAGLQAGADDYVVKPFALEELLARVQAQLRRVWRPEALILRAGDLQLDTGRRIARRGRRLVDLSTTEYHLLLVFLRHPQQVLTREVIGRQVWGTDFEPESNVVDVYVHRLRRKLEAGGEPPLIHTVRRAGYVLRSSVDTSSTSPGRTLTSKDIPAASQ
jgi:two-component system response regulator MprA